MMHVTCSMRCVAYGSRSTWFLELGGKGRRSIQYHCTVQAFRLIQTMSTPLINTTSLRTGGGTCLRADTSDYRRVHLLALDGFVSNSFGFGTVQYSIWDSVASRTACPGSKRWNRHAPNHLLTSFNFEAVN